MRRSHRRYRGLPLLADRQQLRGELPAGATVNAVHSLSNIEFNEAYRYVDRHELGHVAGLAHVGDPHAVMYPEAKLRSPATTR